jgi:hypothetical protein
MKRLGTWLGIAAIALQIAWPLLASARPASVVLVPLCSVDGTTHYLKVPTGKTPVDESSSHGDHCPLCFIGHAGALPAHIQATALPAGGAAERIAPASFPHPKSIFLARAARAPPFLPVVTFNNHELGRYDETALPAGRAGFRAFDGSRFLRLRVLHD